MHSRASNHPHAAVRTERTLNRLAGDDPLTLRVDADGITVPARMTVNPSRVRAAKAGLVHISIPWQDVVRIEVAAGSGRGVPLQYLVGVGGKTAEIGF